MTAATDQTRREGRVLVRHDDRHSRRVRDGVAKGVLLVRVADHHELRGLGLLDEPGG